MIYLPGDFTEEPKRWGLWGYWRIRFLYVTLTGREWSPWFMIPVHIWEYGNVKISVSPYATHYELGAGLDDTWQLSDRIIREPSAADETIWAYARRVDVAPFSKEDIQLMGNPEWMR